MPILVGQTAREFHRRASGLKAGLQGTAHAAKTLLPHAGMKTEIESIEHDLNGMSTKPRMPSHVLSSARRSKEANIT